MKEKTTIPELEPGDFANEQNEFKATSVWPFHRMPPMPLGKSMAMTRSANTEMYILYGAVDPSLDRQHILAAQESARKWETLQSQLKNEAAKRFRIRVTGWAKLVRSLLNRR